LEKSLAYDLDSLAVDVFELTDAGMSVESLTGGHAMTELAASCRCSCCCWVDAISCSGSCPVEEALSVSYTGASGTVEA
jgi:hypothetical protein